MGRKKVKSIESHIFAKGHKNMEYNKTIATAFSQVVDDIKQIIDTGRNTAYAAVDATMIATYWNIGRRIVEEEQHGQERAQYGKELIKMLAKELMHEYGGGYSDRYLLAFRQFYLVIPNYQIWKSRFPNLTWTHIYRTLRVGDETAIRWYPEAASQQMWSVRKLNRNTSTQYYERHYVQPSLPSESTPVLQKEEILKTPMMAEFLGFRQDIVARSAPLPTSKRTPTATGNGRRRAATRNSSSPCCSPIQVVDLQRVFN